LKTLKPTAEIGGELAMPRFVYATAILPGKTDLVRQVYQQKQLHPELEKGEAS